MSSNNDEIKKIEYTDDAHKVRGTRPDYLTRDTTLAPLPQREGYEVHHDLETGAPYYISVEQVEKMRETFKAFTPKLENIKGKIFATGVGGDIDCSEFKNIFCHPDEYRLLDHKYIWGIDPFDELRDVDVDELKQKLEESRHNDIITASGIAMLSARFEDDCKQIAAEYPLTEAECFEIPPNADQDEIDKTFEGICERFAPKVMPNFTADVQKFLKEISNKQTHDPQVWLPYDEYRALHESINEAAENDFKQQHGDGLKTLVDESNLTLAERETYLKAKIDEFEKGKTKEEV